MALKVIEGSWDEILQHAPELQGRRLRVIVLPEPAPKRTGIVSTQLPQTADGVENKRPVYPSE